jgi:hypothetical protein
LVFGRGKAGVDMGFVFWEGVMPLVQAVIVGLFALAGIVITQAWTTQRERQKGRLELAEDVLALFYEAREAIAAIRNPFSWFNDGGTRQRASYETDREAEFKDRAYLPIGRYRQREEFFNGFRAKKFRFVATFRDDSETAFNEIDQVLREIFASAHLLSSHYWPRQGTFDDLQSAEFKDHLEQMHAHEAVFQMISKPDKITDRVDEAVQRIEAITDKAAREYARFPLWRR